MMKGTPGVSLRVQRIAAISSTRLPLNAEFNLTPLGTHSNDVKIFFQVACSPGAGQWPGWATAGPRMDRRIRV